MSALAISTKWSTHGERALRRGGGLGSLISDPGSVNRQIANPASSFDPYSNICLLTIMTQERTASLHRMMGIWDGFVSIALLADLYEEVAPDGIGLLRYHGMLPSAPQRITLSIVEDRGYRVPHNRFPYNVLRNIALEGCNAEYIMAADVDFVPFPLHPSAILRRQDLPAGASNFLCFF